MIYNLLTKDNDYINDINILIKKLKIIKIYQNLIKIYVIYAIKKCLKNLLKIIVIIQVKC